MRRSALAAIVVATCFTPALAIAHSLDFGVLLVEETADGAELVLRAAGHEGTPPAVTLSASGSCVIEEPARRAARGDRLEARARCRGALEGTELALDGLDALTVAVVVRRLDGSEQRAILDAGSPAYRIAGAEGAGAVFGRYLRLGGEHLAGGPDHLLFVLALLLLILRAERGSSRPRRMAGRLAWAVSGFTLGHSLTLAGQVLAGLSLPSAPVEACIALSIAFLAAELARPPRRTLTQRHPAAVAAGFGLLHGFGFAGALGELGWPAAHRASALFSFNLGIELAQLAFVALALPLGLWITRRGKERWPAYAIGVAGVLWTLSRLESLIA